MKKKSYVGRLGALALMLTVITTCLLGGTMARYVTEVTGSATATVASWSFKANENDTTFNAIDLSSTAYTKETLKENVIAPGTSGEFTISIDGTGSDVGIAYDVDIKASTTNPSGGTKLPTSLKFSTEEITAQNTGESLDELMPITNKTIDYSTIANAMKKDITIYWAWDFGENNDTSDNDNDYAGQTWTLDIAVTGKQVAPAESTAP